MTFARTPLPAYVEDEDAKTGLPIPNTRRSAIITKKEQPSSPSSPTSKIQNNHHFYHHPHQHHYLTKQSPSSSGRQGHNPPPKPVELSIKETTTKDTNPPPPPQQNPHPTSNMDYRNSAPHDPWSYNSGYGMHPGMPSSSMQQPPPAPQPAPPPSQYAMPPPPQPTGQPGPPPGLPPSRMFAPGMPPPPYGIPQPVHLPYRSQILIPPNDFRPGPYPPYNSAYQHPPSPGHHAFQPSVPQSPTTHAFQPPHPPPSPAQNHYPHPPSSPVHFSNLQQHSYPPQHHLQHPPPRPSSPAYHGFSAHSEDYHRPSLSQSQTRKLSERLMPSHNLHKTADPIARTKSAFGNRDIRRSIKKDITDEIGYDSANDEHMKSSHQKKKSTQHDRRNSVRVSTPSPQEYHAKYEPAAAAPPPPPPPMASSRSRSIRQPPDDSYESRSKHPLAESRVKSHSHSRRPSESHDPSNYYKYEKVKVEVPNMSRRRKSWNDPKLYDKCGSDYHSKIKNAFSYQEEVTGPGSKSNHPLTAETLRRQQMRENASSRTTKTTRSNSSRDESDLKRSDTTRTTRSGSFNEDKNMTIKVTGSARVLVGGTQIDCNKGGAIEITSDKLPHEGTERSGSEYLTRQAIEDHVRRSRYEKPTGKTRVHSHSRRR